MSATRHNSQWTQERSRILERACATIERKRANGVPVRKTAVRLARNCKNRRYHSEPARRVRLSRKTLVENFYLWLKAGKSAQAFELHYKSGAAKIPASLVREFVRVCALPGTDSMSAGFRKLQVLWRSDQVKRPFKFRRQAELPFSRATYQRALTSEQRSAIMGFQSARIAAIRADEHFKRLFHFD